MTDDEGYLRGINERTHIEKRGEGAAYTEDEGASWTELPADTAVSMNMWGFSADILEELKKRFVVFLEENLEKNTRSRVVFPSVCSGRTSGGEKSHCKGAEVCR